MKICIRIILLFILLSPLFQGCDTHNTTEQKADTTNVAITNNGLISKAEYNFSNIYDDENREVNSNALNMTENTINQFDDQLSITLNLHKGIPFSKPYTNNIPQNIFNEFQHKSIDYLRDGNYSNAEALVKNILNNTTLNADRSNTLNWFLSEALVGQDKMNEAFPILNQLINYRISLAEPDLGVDSYALSALNCLASYYRSLYQYDTALKYMDAKYTILLDTKLNENVRENEILHYISYLNVIGDKSKARTILEKHFSDKMNETHIKKYLIEIESDRPCVKEVMEEQIKKGMINTNRNSRNKFIKTQYRIGP